jgi:hypothetical protein
MKTSPLRFIAVLAISVLPLLTGCESTSFKERLADVPPQVQAVPGEVETVQRAAQKAFKRLNFNLVRTSATRIEAASAINTSETFGDSQQIVARVRLLGGVPGQTEVEVSLSEEVSSASMGGSRQRALREHSFFQTYFAMLQQVLQEMAAEAAADKN